LTPPQPTLASQSSPAAFDPEVVARGERLYRARCVGCHQSGGASGPNLFRTDLSRERFQEGVANGVEGTLMPSFGSLLSQEEIWEIYAFVLSHDRLE
jgi:mono/diheme cytochrome c family protein